MLAFFSIHLKQLRVEKKLTQSQVANYVGVSRSVISAYENDMRYPSYEILIHLSMLFGVSTDYLLGIENKRYLDISELSTEEAAVVHEMVRLFKIGSPLLSFLLCSLCTPLQTPQYIQAVAHSQAALQSEMVGRFILWGHPPLTIALLQTIHR